MRKEILITRPEYDYTTRYISAWAEKIINFAKTKGFSILDLHRQRAKRKELEGLIKKKDPSLIILNGHGNDNEVTGQDDEVLIGVNKNEDILNSRIIYALSCSSGKELGPASVGNGAKAYIGYDDSFVFMYTDSERTRPLQDKTAALFLEPSNQVAISLIKGNNVEFAHQNSKKAFLQNIQKLLTSQSSIEESSTLRYLLWDMQHQVCLGDISATL